MATETSGRAAGRPTILLCPECNSPVYECVDRGEVHFRCRLGHEYSVDQICPGAEENLRNAWANVVRTFYP